MNAPPGDRHAALRIVDASLNRATEGLRVVEDYLRMVLNDAFLSRLAKQLRHDLATAAAAIEPGHLVQARDTPGDVGTQISTASEASRDQIWQVAAASFKRTEQALRSLEEYAKLVDTSLAASAEQIRYRLYTLEKSSGIARLSQTRLADVQVCCLIDGCGSERAFRTKIEELQTAGVAMIQLRDKQLPDRQLLERAKTLAECTRATSTVAIVNDRPDLAAAAGVSGVHLGQEDMPVSAARMLVGPDALVGVSTHSIDQARQAVLDGANYLGAGPTFPSKTKQFEEFPGLDYLRQLAEEISLPAFAIGGIDREKMSEVLATGIGRVAVGSASEQVAELVAAAAASCPDSSTSSSPARIR